MPFPISSLADRAPSSLSPGRQMCLECSETCADFTTRWLMNKKIESTNLGLALYKPHAIDLNRDIAVHGVEFG